MDFKWILIEYKAFPSSQKDWSRLERQKTYHEFIHATNSR